MKADFRNLVFDCHPMLYKVQGSTNIKICAQFVEVEDMNKNVEESLLMYQYSDVFRDGLTEFLNADLQSVGSVVRHTNAFEKSDLDFVWDISMVA